MAGWVYILSNAAMPGLLKIGYTDRNPFSRAREISQATGVPFNFTVEYQIYVSHPYELEQKLHKLLHDYRVNNNREFFKCDYEKVILTIYEVIDRYKFQMGEEIFHRKNKEELARRVILARERESKIKAELSVIDNKRSENLGKLTVDYQNKKMDLKINLISIAIYLIIMQVVIMGIVALVLMGVFKLLNIDIDNVSDGFLLSLSIIITACFYFWYVNFEMKGINDEHTKKISAVNKYYDDLITETITRINRETK